MLPLFNAKWFSGYILSIFYKVHLRKTPKERENELIAQN